MESVNHLKEKSIYQGNERETFIQRRRLRVKTTQLIQFLPVQMLLLNPKNIVIVCSKPKRGVESSSSQEMDRERQRQRKLKNKS